MGSSPRSPATTASNGSKSRRSCKKSATRPLSQALARGQIAETISGTLQLGWLERGQLAACLAQHRIAILCQLIEVVQQVHVEELRGQLLGEARLHPEIELPVTQLEDAMALVVIDHGAVIELGRAQAHGVVGRGKEDQEVLVSQKPAHDLLVGRRQRAKAGLLGCVVQTLSELLELSGSDQFTQMPIHSGGQTCEIFAPVDAPGLQPIGEMRGSTSQRGGRR